MLSFVLDKLKQKSGYNPKEREFMEHFLALAYFRIPSYRQKILLELNKKMKNVDIPECREQSRINSMINT